MEVKSWWLEDASQIQKESPYTFYKPSNAIIDKLIPGEATVKLIFGFTSDDPDAPAAERMWVLIESANTGASFIGRLDNDPFHIKDLEAGDKVMFGREHIIQYDTLNDMELEDVDADSIEKYLKKCFVSNHIMLDGYKVGWFYREEPDDENETGWTFMSSYENEEYVNDPIKNLQYIAIGKVLNLDDSFLGLLDKPVGSNFVRDEETGTFHNTCELPNT